MEDRDIEKAVALLEQEVNMLKQNYKDVSYEVQALKDFSTEQKIMNERLLNNIDNIKEGISDIKNSLCRLEKRQANLEDSQKFNWAEFIKNKAIPSLLLIGFGAYIVSQLVK